MSFIATPGIPTRCEPPRSRAGAFTFINAVGRARAYYRQRVTLNLHRNDVYYVPMRPSVTSSRSRSPIRAN
eukprot:8126338-Heterocapsa_arctica.AAC.1